MLSSFMDVGGVKRLDGAESGGGDNGVEQGENEDRVPARFLEKKLRHRGAKSRCLKPHREDGHQPANDQ